MDCQKPGALLFRIRNRGFEALIGNRKLIFSCSGRAHRLSIPSWHHPTSPDSARRLPSSKTLSESSHARLPFNSAPSRRPGSGIFNRLRKSAAQSETPPSLAPEPTFPTDDVRQLGLLLRTASVALEYQIRRTGFREWPTRIKSLFGRLRTVYGATRRSAIQSLTMPSSTFSVTAPWPRIVSWKSRRLNLSPSSVSAFLRSSRIRSWPIL